MGKPEMKKTAGHWGLSGPGLGGGVEPGRRERLSVDRHRRPTTTRPSPRKTIEVPAAGKYYVWVRYGDWREKTERFQVQIEQAGRPPWTGSYGEKPVVEEDNEMKLYWGWAFAWDERDGRTRRKGRRRSSSLSTTQGPAAAADRRDRADDRRRAIAR